MLDPVEQRILGVLIEKERTVPDTYPLTENSLRMGCNQSNNREPVMSLTDQDMALPLRGLMEQSWVARVDGSGRTTKWRHKAVERLGITLPELCVLCELLIRGPQAPGALKPRVQRLGCETTPGSIEATLLRMAQRPEPLVVELPLGPRERDRRWAHRLGGDSIGHQDPPQAPTKGAGSEALRPDSLIDASPFHAPMHSPETSAQPYGELEERIRRIEQEVAALRATLAVLLQRGAS